MQQYADHRTQNDAVRVSVQGDDPGQAITSLAGLYAGKAWYSRPTSGRYGFHYAGVGDTGLSIRRSRMRGYLRGDVATEGEFVVQWIDSGEARIDVGRDEVRLAPGVPTLFPTDRRFAMEYQDWDQRLVHMDRGLVLDVASSRFDVSRGLVFDHTASPTPEATARWMEVVRQASATLRDAGPNSLVWHTASRRVAQAFLELYPPRLAAAMEYSGDLRHRVARAAADYIHAHLHEPLTSTMIAENVGVSVRTLQADFQQALDTTPMTYVRTARLQQVRVELGLADPMSTTVAQVARSWGFAHMGRFSGEYAKLFGEYPSETLRNG